MCRHELELAYDGEKEEPQLKRRIREGVARPMMLPQQKVIVLPQQRLTGYQTSPEPSMRGPH